MLKKGTTCALFRQMALRQYKHCAPVTRRHIADENAQTVS